MRDKIKKHIKEIPYEGQEVDRLLKARTELIRRRAISYGATESLTEWINKNI